MKADDTKLETELVGYKKNAAHADVFTVSDGVHKREDGANKEKDADIQDGDVGLKYGGFSSSETLLVEPS